MRPTLRAAFLVGLGIPLSLVLIVGNEGLWLFGVLYLFFVLLLIGFDSLNMVLPSRLNLQQDIPSLLHAGGDDYAYFKLTVDTTQRAFGLDALLEVDETYLKRPDPAYISRLERSVPVDLAFPLRVKRRGSCQLSRLWLRWYSPWGLVERKTVWDLKKTVTIIPNITAVKSAALQLSSRDAFHGIKVQKQQGDGTEFDALREYVPGFDLRSVDWKHSARHRKLVCKEFQVERNHNVILAFDTGHLMCRPLDGLPQLDHMINAGLLLGYMALRGGDRVGLYGFNSRIQMFAEPLGGSRAFHHLQANCARLEYQHDETNFTLGLANLLGKLPRRSLIVIYTDFVDTVTAELMIENITRLAKRHLILFVTLSDRELMNISQLRPGSVTDIARSVIADDFLRERRIVFERLRRLGVHCLEAPAASVSAALVERYLEIKQQELI
ncbi:DUF58 domain-containing protein [Kiloniella laminariae]|uniref:DUF58 domain-containing protein n=1 Tax=Kiloniella laminariae TaxID=454162 RepID=A0ABT4LNN5_9PROT|nr:DUF58 domain-containing protein [Kiloniella laminariae]MCZ4282757.1 DUF58 domain-containing protein [Kiloniella laminariae]